LKGGPVDDQTKN